jgi:hypothetical protein
LTSGHRPGYRCGVPKGKTNKKSLTRRARTRRATKRVPLALLTTALADEVAAALGAGNYSSVAFRRCGIEPRTGADWLRRGKLMVEVGDEDLDGKPPYRYLYESCAAAQERAQVAIVALVGRAALTGHPPEYGYVERVVGGKVVEIKKLVRPGTPPDWRAGTWLLERRWPENWAQVARTTPEPEEDVAPEEPAEATRLDPRSHVAKALGLPSDDAVDAFGVLVAKRLTAVQRSGGSLPVNDEEEL